MKPDHALNDLLRVAKMPRSSFYYKEIKRNYHEAKEAILSLYKKNKNRDGYRPMTLKLRQMGFHLNHKTVLKLMNELGIHSILRKKRHGKRGNLPWLKQTNPIWLSSTRLVEALVNRSPNFSIKCDRTLFCIPAVMLKPWSKICDL